MTFRESEQQDAESGVSDEVRSGVVVMSAIDPPYSTKRTVSSRCLLPVISWAAEIVAYFVVICPWPSEIAVRRPISAVESIRMAMDWFFAGVFGSSALRHAISESPYQLSRSLLLLEVAIAMAYGVPSRRVDGLGIAFLWTWGIRLVIGLFFLVYFMSGT